jgi:hypothetical protein
VWTLSREYIHGKVNGTRGDFLARGYLGAGEADDEEGETDENEDDDAEGG